ncbi:hypothetical protein SLEP1_g19878 [Rubroshorea leprosula]|uniref:laccase n=1 Tax=Rubroshorea leprosula TaxID=152421 RepID=A0AAV5J0S1_9ROSI|nr:hypothetical protein SLEP1_g19878 [Rubroshorea leprosula]
MGASFFPSTAILGAFLLHFVILCLHSEPALGVTRHYKFDVYQATKYGCLSNRKSIVSVNGQLPGPRIVAREGEQLLIKVVNYVFNNMSIHWQDSALKTVSLTVQPCPEHIMNLNFVCNDRHGIRQLRTGWTDGPAYVTQCPIQTGQSYMYNFTITGQRGTLFWHAHISWLRATVCGPFIILPKHGVPYPFPKPHKEVSINFGELFNADPEAIISQALQTGGGPSVSDACTLNGLPGPLYNCSAKDTFRLKVKPGKIYLRRLINASLNDELFFSIANHSLTVVEADAVYVKPFETQTLLIAPGQTTNVLLKSKPHYPNASFFMTARPYVTGLGTFDSSTMAGILEYVQPPNKFHKKNSINKLPLFKPILPALNDTSFTTNFTKKLRSTNAPQFAANVPHKVDRKFFFTVGLGTSPCQGNQTCQGPNGTMFAASVNNVSFAMPTTSLLHAHFSSQSYGVYTPDFPINPVIPFNYTGTPPNNTMVSNGTKLVVLPFNTSFGNFDPNKDPKNFNLVDPVERSAAGGWVAIRFLADNPVHTIWGLKMACIVLDAKLPNQKLLPPPADLPKWQKPNLL